MNRHLTALCACLLAWNTIFPAFVFIESEAVAINRASNAHGHIKEHAERWPEMEKTMDAERARRWPYFHLLAVTAGVNVVVAAIALLMAYRSKSPAG